MTLKGIFSRASYATEQRAWIQGRLGRLADDGVTYVIKIPYRQNWVWVRMGANGDQGIQAAYKKGDVALRGNLPVRMKLDNGVLTIYETDTTLLTSDPNAPSAPSGIPPHHHRTLAGTPPVANPLSYVYEAKQMDRGRVAWAGGMTVSIAAFRYYHNGAWETWEGGTLDLTPYQTSTSGEWSWVLVGVDPATNTAVAVAGTSVSTGTALDYGDLDAIAFGAYIPLAAVKVRESDTTVATITDYTDAQGWYNGGPGKAATAVVYVAKTGADVLDGLNIQRPKLTIGSAITAAAALITAGADKVRIEVMDGGIYAESLTLAPKTILFAPSATITGLLVIDDGCSVQLDRHYVDATNSQVLLARATTGTGEVASYRANLVDGRGVGGAVTGTICLQNESSTGVLFAWVGQIFVPSGGFGLRDSAAAGFGHIHFILNDLYLAGNNAIGIRNTNANTNLIGYIDHILEIGTPTGTKGIQILASGGVVKLTATEIIADEAYDLAGGTLYLSCPKVTGTLTGTPTSEQSDRLVKTAESRPTTLTATGTKTTPIDADSTYIADSAASGNLKTTTWANLKATLKAYFDTLYATTAGWFKLAGVAGGQTAYGGTASGNNLVLRSTSHATKGAVKLADDGGSVELANSTIINTAAEPALTFTGAAGRLTQIIGTTGGGIGFYNYNATALWGGFANDSYLFGIYPYGKTDTTARLMLQLRSNDASTWTQLRIFSIGAATQANREIIWQTSEDTVSNLGNLVLQKYGGNVGFGITPQGKFHVHDGTGGMLSVSLTGINATPQTIVANGTGDIVRGCNISAIGTDGTNHGQRQQIGLLQGGTTTTTVVCGTTTVTITLNADGSLTVVRTAGAGTISLSLLLHWL